MRQRIRKWLAETHGTRFELLRHFLPRFFDSELISSSVEWTRIVGGVVTTLIFGLMLFANLMSFKYRVLGAANLRDRIPAEIQRDLISLSGMAMCLTILLVAALWQAIYPTLRDYLALAAFPVNSADIFTAKMTALLIAFSTFELVLTLPVAIIFGAVSRAGIATAFLTMASACSLAFFGLIAIQGLLLNILPGRVFERVMIWIQGLLVAVSLGGFPLAAWRGREILGEHRISPSHLLAASALAFIIAAVTYILSFHRYRRLMLEAPRIVAPERASLISRIISGVTSRVMDRFVRDPREQAALGFIWKTMQRSRTHRLAVLTYAGLAVAWVVKSAIEAMVDSGSGRDVDRMVLTAAPLALIVFTLLGLRHLFSLPAELRANWMFQIAEREGRRAWLNSVERFVLVCGVAPVVLIGAIFVFRADGLLTGAAWTAVAFFLAAIGFERLFRGWRKLPFTCSYLPGRRPLIINLTIFFIMMLLLTPVAWIVYRCATNPASFLVMLTIEIAVWLHLRRSRMASWGVAPLVFEDKTEAEIDTFGFSGDGTVVAQEEFQREWNEYLRGDRNEPILRPLDDGETRVRRVWDWLTAAPQDLKYSLRLLMKKPGFALSVVATLGLGLGLNAAFFTVFNAFLLRPLAVRDPASLVSIDFQTRYRTAVHLSLEDYRLLAANGGGFGETAASTVEGTGLEGRAAKIGIVSSNYFTMLGVGTALGRPFQAGEQEAVIVLNYRAWQSRFASDEGIIGRRLLVNGSPFEVIGIAAPEFGGVAVGAEAIAPRADLRFGLGAADLWVPFEVWNRIPSLPKYPVRGVIGRLRPEATAGQTQVMISSYARRATASQAEYERIAGARLESLDIPVTWTALSFSLPLLIAFGLTMLIPCANAANMMLARSMARQRELGTRLSLGASRGRIVRQLLTESLVLAILAGAAGLAVARIALQFFSQSLYSTAPPTLLFRVRIPEFVIDTNVFFYMLLVAGLTTVLFALAPAAQATRVAVSYALRGEFGALRPSRMRDGLVVAQVSACMMLLVMAGVLLRGTGRATKIDRGYDTRGVYGAVNQSPEDAAALVSILDTESWVETRAFMGGTLSEMGSLQVANPARPGWQNVYFHNSSGDFFQLVRIPLVKGRTFTRAEAESWAPVTVVSELAARQLWPGEDPIGKTLAIQPGQQRSMRIPRFKQATVIGVCRDVISKAKDGGPRPTVHFPDALRPGTVVAVRGRGTPDQTARQLEAAMARAPGANHGARVAALQEVVDFETYPQQAASWLSSILGVVALLLTITGIYGVMSYLVSQRTKEIGIRIALGATPARIARLVLTYSARLAGVGMVFGTILALGALKYCASKIDLAIDLYDMPAYSLSLAAVVLAALFAALAPTRRACAVDPQVAVRTD